MKLRGGARPSRPRNFAQDQPASFGKAMKTRRVLFALTAATLLAGCSGQPVPPEKAAFVGEWQAETMYLLITQDGSVLYRRLKAGATSSLEGPFKGFVGDKFRAGIGPIGRTFTVTKPPHRAGGQWKMVVDGVELTRTRG